MATETSTRHAAAMPPSAPIAAAPETLAQAAALEGPSTIALDAARYLAAVDVFRNEGRPPRWRPETAGGGSYA